jgi:hypothetical protein
VSNEEASRKTVALAALLVGLLAIAAALLAIWYTAGRQGFGFRGRATLPTIDQGYSAFAFMQSAELLQEFEAEVTSQGFIEEVLASKPQYAKVRDQFLAHWKPQIVQVGDGRHLVNATTWSGGNVTLDLAYEDQATLEALRKDIYDATEKLLREFNRKYEQRQPRRDPGKG